MKINVEKLKEIKTCKAGYRDFLETFSKNGEPEDWELLQVLAERKNWEFFFWIMPFLFSRRVYTAISSYIAGWQWDNPGKCVADDLMPEESKNIVKCLKMINQVREEELIK